MKFYSAFLSGLMFSVATVHAAQGVWWKVCIDLFFAAGFALVYYKLPGTTGGDHS